MRSIPWKQLVLSLGVVVVVAWRVPFGGLRTAFHNLEAGSLAVALFSLLLLLFLRAYKWHRLMASAGHRLLRQSLRSLFGGFALGLITPGRLGELGRAVFVRHEERAQVLLLTLFDRLLDFWALLTSIGASLFFLAPRPVAVFGFAVWLAMLPMVMGFPVLVSHLARLALKSRHFRGHLMEAAEGMPRVPTPRFALLALGAMWAELASFFFLLRAFFPTKFSTALATYPYIVLAGDLPVSFSGVGIREGAAALLLSPYAVPSVAAVDASVVWFVFAILFPAVLGAVWLGAERAMGGTRKSHGLTPVTPDGRPTLAPTALPSSPTSLRPESAPPRCDARLQAGVFPKPGL